MKKIFRMFLLGIAAVLGVFLAYFFVGSSSEAKEVMWGVNFSKKHAEALDLDWRTVYTDLLDDLGVKRIKLSVDWSEIEPEPHRFSFEDIDWQVKEAEKRNGELLLVVGMKTLRWPECHIPEWAKGLSKHEQQAEVLRLLKEIISRYKDSPALYLWQVENEPLFSFGECPQPDREFLEREVALVKSLDPAHPVVVSDSGELSLWVRAAQIGDIVSVTMYRKVWFREINRYVEYPLPPVLYARKTSYIHWLFDKEVIGGELQAEPWGPGKLLYETTLEEQDRAFTIAQFRKNIEYAKRTGLAEHYIWGAEWWYWRKEIADDPSFWDEARNFFAESA